MFRRLSIFAILMFCICFCSTENEYDEIKDNDKLQPYEKDTAMRKYSPSDLSLVKPYNVSNDEAKKKMTDSKVYENNEETVYDDGEHYNTYEYEGENSDFRSESVKDVEANVTESKQNKSCKFCQMREESRKLRLHLIQETIINELGFSRNNLPKVTGKTFPRPPSILKLIEEYGMQSDAPYTSDDGILPEDIYNGQVQKAFTIAQKPPDSLGGNVPGGCYFELPDTVISRKIQDATLWIYLEMPVHRKQVIDVFVYVIQSKKPVLMKSLERRQELSFSKWIAFTLTHYVHRWAKHPDANLGLVIKALDSEGNNIVVTPGYGNESYFPMLEMATLEYRGKHRNKRTVQQNICTEEEKIDTCCRYPLRVDFVQFGWDWVIAPTGYMANYCSGECKFRHLDNSPQAYIIQQTNANNGPCCTPSKYNPLSLLYFDHSHTVLYVHMQKMIVTKCGCA